MAEFGSNRDPKTVEKKMAVMHAVVQAPVQAIVFFKYFLKKVSEPCVYSTNLCFLQEKKSTKLCFFEKAQLCAVDSRFTDFVAFSKKHKFVLFFSWRKHKFVL